MGVHRFVAANARAALERVRRELGDDALVLASRPHADGIEVLASAYGELAQPAPEPVAGGSRILRELANLRALVQNQLAGFAWSSARRRDPQRVLVLQTLFAAGFGSQLARTLAARLPRGLDGDAVARWLRQVLIRNLAVLDGEHELLAAGRLALVGPTGAGKTTTLAKLAQRAVARHGTAALALVCADPYRIGAAAQLRIYAERLGVEFCALDDVAELGSRLSALAGKRLVLVDTAGFNPDDARVAPGLAALDALAVRRVLVVPANAQAAAIDRALTTFGGGAAAAILGKWDEAVQPGAALDGLIRHRLPLAWVSSGQRVPEDLHAPNAAYLVDRALKGGRLDTPYALREADWPLFAGVEAARDAQVAPLADVR
jgi:flagellar biosynthesis protein FlhF